MQKIVIMLKFKYLLFILTPFILASCSIGRVLDKPAYVKVKNTNFTTEYQSEINKYLNLSEEDIYLQAFENQLEESLKSYNISIVTSSNGNVDPSNLYVIDVKRIYFEETYTIETEYMDSLAEYPESFEVVECDVNVETSLYEIDNSGNEKLMKSTTVYVDKEEKLSNNRTFWQVIFGTNKDNSEFTYKELNEDVFQDLCEKAARRVAAKTSKTIYKDRN